MSDKLSPMQEQLLGQASSILQSVTDTVSKASTFAAEQLPDIALQYVAYGRATMTTLVLLGVLGLIAFWWVVIQVCFKNKYGMKDSEGRAFMGFLATMVLGVPSFVILAVNLSDFFMVWVAPKVWLIKELVHLVK